MPGQTRSCTGEVHGGTKKAQSVTSLGAKRAIILWVFWWEGDYLTILTRVVKIEHDRCCDAK